MPKYSYLLFDADDTLLDFERNGARAFTMLCAKYHFPCTPESRDLYESFNQPLWRELERGLVTKEFMKVAGEYLALKENNLFGSDTDIAALLDKLALPKIDKTRA